MKTLFRARLKRQIVFAMQFVGFMAWGCGLANACGVQQAERISEPFGGGDPERGPSESPSSTVGGVRSCAWVETPLSIRSMRLTI